MQKQTCQLIMGILNEIRTGQIEHEENNKDYLHFGRMAIGTLQKKKTSIPACSTAETVLHANAFKKFFPELQANRNFNVIDKNMAGCDSGDVLSGNQKRSMDLYKVASCVRQQGFKF